MDVLSRIEERKEDLFNILSDLIKIDTQSFGNTGKEANITEYLKSFLEKLGYTPDVYSPLSIEGMENHPDYWPGHNLETRFNVSAVIPGIDSSKRIMLAAHIDTVAIGEDADWTVPPLGGLIKDGKIWGRGACDNKCGIATALFLIKVFKEEGLKFPCDIVFTAYCDEEYGGSHGALAACLKYPSDDIINLDGEVFEIADCAVGGEEMRAHIKAKGPIDDCGEMLEGLKILKEELDKFREKRVAELNAHEEYRITNIPDDSVRFLEIKAGNAGTNLDKAYIELCYYAAATKEEINEEFDVMAKKIDEKLEPLGLTFDRFEKTTRFFHFMKADKINPLIEKLIEAGKLTSGREMKTCGMCQSDLSIFLKYGSPRAFCFGVGRKFFEYGGAHQADEHVLCDELLEMNKILAKMFTM